MFITQNSLSRLTVHHPSIVINIWHSFYSRHPCRLQPKCLALVKPCMLWMAGLLQLVQNDLLQTVSDQAMLTVPQHQMIYLILWTLDWQWLAVTNTATHSAIIYDDTILIFSDGHALRLSWDIIVAKGNCDCHESLLLVDVRSPVQLHDWCTILVYICNTDYDIMIWNIIAFFYQFVVNCLHVPSVMYSEM